MMKHTPGPWMVLPSVAEGQFAILTKLGVRQDIAVTYGFEHTPRQANARLIAAAPDLLEVVIQLLRVFPTDSDLIEAGWSFTDVEVAMKAHDAARAAIAKATGEPA